MPKDSPKRKLWWTVPTLNDYCDMQGYCLITATLLGFHHRKTLAFDNPDLSTFQFLRKHTKSKASAEKLHSTVKEIVAELNLSESERMDYEQCLPALAEYMKIQIVLLSELADGAIVHMSPAKFDPSLLPVYLYELRGENDEGHAEPIIRLSGVQSYSGLPCLYCGKVRRGRHLFHKCVQSGGGCVLCKKNLVGPNHYYDKELSRYLCDSRLFPSFSYHCDICKTLAYGPRCFKNHRGTLKSKTCMNQGKTCEKCKTFIIAESGQKVSEVLQHHKCNLELCRKCFKYFSPEEGRLVGSHQCQFPTVRDPGPWPRLAFLFCHFWSSKSPGEHELVTDSLSAISVFYENQSSQELFRSLLVLPDGSHIHGAEEKMQYIPGGIAQKGQLRQKKKKAPETRPEENWKLCYRLLHVVSGAVTWHKYRVRLSKNHGCLTFIFYSSRN